MKSPYFLGLLLGICVPLFGVFAGLQVSVLLGNILAHPLLLISMIAGQPFGALGAHWWLIALTFSVLEWIVLVYLVRKFARS